MLLDFHIHTKHSGDCSLECADLLKFYEGRDCAVIAITDHDSIAAHSENVFTNRARESPRIIPAVELTLEEKGYEFHFLCYNPPTRPDAQAFLDATESTKHRGTLSFIGKINALLLQRGILPIDEGALLEQHGRVHSYHFAGHICTVSELTYQQAYEEIIDPVRNSSPRGLPSVSEALASGFTSLVVAHPYGRSHSVASFAQGDANLFRDLLREFRASGVVGLEALSRHHTPDQVLRLQKVAARYGYLCTGGSDLHHWHHFDQYLDLIRSCTERGLSYTTIVEDSSVLLQL